jgi:hypothetical protein
MFYSEPHPVASAALHSSGSDQSGGLKEHEPLIHSALPAPLAIRCSLVIAGPDGADHEVDPEAPVSISDRPRLAVQTVRARTTMIFPLAGLIADPAANPVLHLRVTFARRPPDPKDLLSQTPRPPLMERLEPVPGRPPEHAIYAAADPGESAPPMLIVELALNQRP